MCHCHPVVPLGSRLAAQRPRRVQRQGNMPIYLRKHWWAPSGSNRRPTDFERVFSSAPERLSGMPYDELAHRGRGFLWPWQWGWRLPPKV